MSGIESKLQSSTGTTKRFLGSEPKVDANAFLTVGSRNNPIWVDMKNTDSENLVYLTSTSYNAADVLAEANR